MTQQHTSTDVLVAGAGPTGLTLALTLSRLGVEALTVDPLPAPAAGSRANLMHAGSLERLETLGVTDELLGHGAIARRGELHSGGRVLTTSDWGALDSRFPMALLIPQSTTEAVLDMALSATGAGVDRGWGVTGLAPAPDAVTADLTDGDGASRSVTARYVVGCDGAHSTVRKQTGVGFDGQSYPESLLVADCPGSGLPVGASRIYFTPDDGFLVASTMADDVTRIGASVAPGFQPEAAEIATLVRRRSYGEVTPDVVADASLFRTHRRRVEHMRVGRILLAGDAAHVHSPAGGQGMNLGIRDAFDLGHRLAAHLAGDAPDSTLDEYDEQRGAEAAEVLAATNRLMRLYTATGLRRRLLDIAMRAGSRIGVSQRIVVAVSGIETPWPPGVERPAPV